MRRSRSAAVLFTLAASTTACIGPERDAFPEGDPSTAASTADGSAASSTASASVTTGGGGEGPSPCDPIDHVCVPDPPAGWAGPVASYEGPLGAELPSCEDTPYPARFADYFADLDEGAPACECACEPATGITCGDATLCFRANISQCNVLCGTEQSLADGECAPTLAQSTLVSVNAPAPTDAGACEAIDTGNIPTPEWGTATRVCGGPTQVRDCEAGSRCAPLPGAGRGALCVVHEGEVACPDAVWSVPRVRYAAYDDDRACRCECGPATSTCAGAAHFRSSCLRDEKLVVYAEVLAGACAGYRDSGDPPFVRYDADPSGSCEPIGADVPEGGVTLEGTVTLCCLE